MFIDLETIGMIVFALVFAILGLFLIFLHIPKTDEFKYYRQSRRILGTAFLIMTLYCLIEPALPDEKQYSHTCLLILFSLIFSWLNYSTFLTLIYTSRIVRRSFFLDGIIPISIMLVVALIGYWYPKMQHINSIVFGVIFALKCLWMFYTSIREYRKVHQDLENNYDQTPDIRWMLVLLILTFFLSIVTLIAFYNDGIRYIYEPLAIAIYVYMTFRMVNYLPKKISRMRTDYVKSETTEKPETKNGNPVDLKSKLDPTVNRWIQNKGYTKPDTNIKIVAAEMGTNQNYLSKYINSVLGTTFSVWLNTLRVEESKKLLTAPKKLSIEEIGQQVGIMEIYNYSRWFKTVTGMTPQQYRRENSTK